MSYSTINITVNVTTGYTLAIKRHNRVHTFFLREMGEADWSMRTFTLLSRKRNGVHPAMATFLHDCTLVFGNVPCCVGKLEAKLEPSAGHLSAGITFRSHQRSPNYRSSDTKHTKVNGRTDLPTTLYIFVFCSGVNVSFCGVVVVCMPLYV